jgi:hypothetical protein
MRGSAAIRAAAHLLWLPGLSALPGATGPAAAQAARPSPAFEARARALVGLFNGQTPAAGLLSPSFLAAVPAERVAEISTKLRASYGPAKAVLRIEANRSTEGMVFIQFERSIVRLQMAIGPEPHNLVEGLRVLGVEAGGRDLPTVVRELVGLPGVVSLAAARLDDPGPVELLAQKSDRPLAIGSTFKLFVLAELVREIKAGERRWTDVVALGPPSLPSGFLRDWPRGSPITLHSLAALMISQSDNSATDTLISLLGRDKVESLLPALGVRAPERNRPFLTTREAFALKLGDQTRLQRWKTADEAGRRTLLTELDRVESSTLDPSRRGGRPADIAAVEWFASPADLVRTLDWLRRNGDETALDLLAINPGLGPALAAEFDYFGFKGGSEPGVLNLSFLLKARSGRWIAISATWNSEAAALDEPRFLALMSRLVALLK